MLKLPFNPIPNSFHGSQPTHGRSAYLHLVAPMIVSSADIGHDEQPGPFEADQVLRALPRAKPTDGRMGGRRPRDQAAVCGEGAR